MIELYSSSDTYKLYKGNMLDMLEVIKPNSIDAIVTDPPYELGFMSKSWDSSGVAFQKDTWEKCLKVLKPGGYLLSFGGSRTFHRIACAIEDAGFEIRDTIMWLYGSGFPKSMNIGLAIDKKNGVDSPVIGQNESILKKQAKDIREGHRKIVDSYNAGATERNNGFSTVSADIKQAQNEWQGWGTALKPAYEPIVVARKPCEGTCIDNVMKYGVGGINIDECRVGDDLIKGGTTPNFRDVGRKQKEISGIDKLSFGQVSNAERIPLEDHNGRYPSNVILTYDETDQEEVCGGMPESKGASSQNNFSNGHIYRGQSLQESSTSLSGYREWYNDDGSAARYFYCAKASKRDRDEGCDDLDDKYVAMGNQAKAELKRGNLDFTGDPRSPLNSFNTVQQVKNSHPCVKPCDLMQYLVRLVTPKNGTVLDPFNGSGSTGKAVAYENFDRDSNYRYIGIELSEEYLAISDARIKFVENTPKQFKLF